MKKFIYALCCVLCISIAWHTNGYRKIAIKIHSEEYYIPRRDAKRLEYFFKELIIYSSAGFTILGNKPLSFDYVFIPRIKWDYVYLWHAFFPSNLKKYSALKTWKKYEHLFNKGDIQIWSEPSPILKSGEWIVVARKKELERIIQENRQELGNLQNLEPRALFKEVIGSHDGQLGILLGYGRGNAWLFYEKKHALLKSVFSEELNHLFENKRAVLNYIFGCPRVEISEILMYPNFYADMQSEETKTLKSDYLQTRKKILDFYADKNFLEATLQLIDSP